VDARDLELRRLTYGLLVELGHVPTADEVASAAGRPVADVEASWRRLHDAHALVLAPGGSQILMANPFSGVPTRYRVHAGGRSWYAPCAWDAFGICAALHADGRIETACPECGDPIAVDVRAERPSDTGLLFHCLVPAEHWWDDIAFT